MSRASAPAVQAPAEFRDRAEAEAYVASVCFKHGPPRLIGAELEWIVQHSGNPHQQPDIDHLATLLGPHAPHTVRSDSPALPLPHGSPITLEPGGQLEISSPPAGTLRDLAEIVTGDTAALHRLIDPADLRLLHLGADPIRPSRRIVGSPRYASMESAFDRVGSHGRTMMCSTAAIQVCLDAGEADQVAVRWATLHEIGPTLLAAFANSPVLAGRRTGWASSRMAAWFALDPVRTRPHPVHPDPAADWARRALDTPLLCRRRPGGCWDVPAGISFADWLAGALAGRPTTEDLDYHLSTLFPPVRPHGHLEVRYLDTQPLGQWSVPVAVLAAVLADPATAEQARAHCAPAVDRWAQAAQLGLADPVLARAAVGIFDLACTALPALDPPRWMQALLEDLTQRRVHRGRCPADDQATTGGTTP